MSEKAAKENIQTRVRNRTQVNQPISLKTSVYDINGKEVAKTTSNANALKDSVVEIAQEVTINSPVLWSVDAPQLYKAVSQVAVGGMVMDGYTTSFGIRYLRSTGKDFY